MKVRLRVKELRREHPDKPTQRFMAELLNMTETNYRRLEGNQLDSVKLTHLSVLAEFFGCKDPNSILEFIND